MAKPSEALQAVIDAVAATSPPSARGPSDRFAHFEGVASDLRKERGFVVTVTGAPARLPELSMCARRSMEVEVEVAYAYTGHESMERVCDDGDALEAALWALETSSPVIVGVTVAESLPVAWDPQAHQLILTIPLTVEFDRG